MKEEWRDIKGYEGLYQISNLGRIKSLKDNHGKYREKILKPGNSNGYFYVDLCKNSKGKLFKIHRLVAIHFIENPNNYPEVNHKDENSTNNCVDNLEWCTREYNNSYGTRNKRASEKLKGSKNPKSRKVQCITTGKKFNTIREAGEYYGLSQSITDVNITKCCQGKVKSAGKHPDTGEKLKWKYVD